jgi:prepilin-type processing-associated H-X9-DG protein
VLNKTISVGVYQKDFLSGRHFGGGNIAFADGHVKWVKAETIVKEATAFGSGSPATVVSAWNPASG